MFTLTRVGSCAWPGRVDITQLTPRISPHRYCVERFICTFLNTINIAFYNRDRRDLFRRHATPAKENNESPVLSEVLGRAADCGRQSQSQRSGRWQPRLRLRFSSVCFVGPNPSNGENKAIEGKKERTEVRSCLGSSAYLTVIVRGVEWLSAPDVPVTVKVT